jgi:predicted ester cyclase
MTEDAGARSTIDFAERSRKGQPMSDETPQPPAKFEESSRQNRAASAEENKAASRRWVEAFNDRDQRGEAAARAADFIAHAPASLEPAPLDSEAWTQFLSAFLEGFPDLKLTVEDAVGDGELVAQRLLFKGTHTGVFQGLPPTNREVKFSGLELNRMVDGKVAEHWVQMDVGSLLQQLGLRVVPRPRLLPRLLAQQAKKLFRKRPSTADS